MKEKWQFNKSNLNWVIDNGKGRKKNLLPFTCLKSMNVFYFLSDNYPGDDISGSGSGMCVGGHCPRSRPGLYAYAPDNNRVRGTATSQSGICSLLLLLPLTILLLQR